MMETAFGSTRPVVLVVEDDPDVADVVRVLLEGHGYTVESAADGVAGLARIEAGEVDLVLLDLMLPGMDGLEVCQRVRARGPEVGPRSEAVGASDVRPRSAAEGAFGVYLPIIMLTALHAPEQRHAGFAAGADDYVTKPFDADDVLDRVQVWMQTRLRLKAYHARVMQQQEALRAAERREAAAQVEGIKLAARELAHRLNNQLAVPVGLVELLETRPDVPADLAALVHDAAAALGQAARDVESLHRVVRIETWETPVGPALDLDRAVRRDSE